LDVVAKRDRVDEKALGQVVEADADLFARREEEGSNVNVGLELVTPQQLERELDELLRRVRDGETHYVRRTPQSFVVCLRLQQKKLLALGVPVSPDAFEDPGAVVQGMGHQSELDVVVAAELTVVEDP